MAQRQLIPPERLRRAHIAELRMRLHRLHRHEQFVVIAMLAELEEARARRRRRTYWVKPWLQRRVLLGQYDTLMQELSASPMATSKPYAHGSGYVP